LGIGDWGLGIGDWAQSPIPNPHLFSISLKIYLNIKIKILSYLFALNNIINKKIDKKTKLNKIKILYN